MRVRKRSTLDVQSSRDVLERRVGILAERSDVSDARAKSGGVSRDVRSSLARQLVQRGRHRVQLHERERDALLHVLERRWTDHDRRRKLRDVGMRFRSGARMSGRATADRIGVHAGRCSMHVRRVRRAERAHVPMQRANVDVGDRNDGRVLRRAVIERVTRAATSSRRARVRACEARRAFVRLWIACSDRVAASRREIPRRVEARVSA